MDAFFASVEVLDQPELAGRPVLVGGAPPRGVVSSASYEARAKGARSAMPMARALRLCPGAIVLPPRMRRYAELSASVFAIFGRYTPLVEGLSIDEAFLDVTGSRALFGSGPEIAGRIRADLLEELGLSASVGVAPSKFVAKIASDLKKPGGLVVVPPDEVGSFLAPLPIERMWGVGPKAAERLRRAGFATLGDLADSTLERLEALLGQFGRTIGALARGEDERPVVPGGKGRSIGAEETFPRDLHTIPDLERALLGQAVRVASRAADAGVSGRRITVKVKYSDFAIRSRQRLLPHAIADTDAIYQAARSLLADFPNLGRGVRLTGISLGDLASGPPAPTLFPEPSRERRAQLENVVQNLRSRFGSRGVTRATLLDPEVAPTPPASSSRERRDPADDV